MDSDSDIWNVSESSVPANRIRSRAFADLAITSFMIDPSRPTARIPPETSAPRREIVRPCPARSFSSQCAKYTSDSETAGHRRDLRQNLADGRSPSTSKGIGAHVLSGAVCRHDFDQQESAHTDQLAAVLLHHANIDRTQGRRLGPREDLHRPCVQSEGAHDGSVADRALADFDHLEAGHSPHGGR